ncbi:MAG: M28 family peptidase [Eubacteriales bacterium]
MKFDFKKMTADVLKHTEALIEKFGAREAGSQNGRDCAHEMFDDLSGFSDSTIIEDVDVHTGAFLGWIRILVALYLVGTIALWFKFPAITALLLLVGILVMVFQFFLYKHTIDFLFKKKTAHNVTGILEPEGEVKQQIIIAGHHDSARVFNFFVQQPKLYGLRVMGGIGLLAVVFLLSSILAIVPVPDWLTIALAILASVGALLVSQLWFFYGKESTYGAGDNLAASVMGVEMLRAFAKAKASGKGLKHTRLAVISFDGEEEGLRGAHAYAKAHATTIEKVPTYLFNIDCLYSKKDMFFLTTDINGSVKMSEDFAKECQATAKDLGIETEVKPIAFLTGGTDAGELAKVGAKATTLMGMPWDNTERASVYHTMDDTVDSIEPEAIESGLAIIARVIEKKDKEAIKA